MSKSNSGRFVRAAWSLLFFQVVASAGAVAVTGWAVMHVQNLPAVQQAAAPAATVPVETTEATPAPATDVTTPAPTTAVAAPADAPTPAPAPAATATAAPAVADVGPCQRVERYWRVTTQVQWCDTGIDVQRGRTMLFIHGGGAPLGALSVRVGDTTFTVEGRVSSPADGRVQLSLNRGGDNDNQGYADVYVGLR